METIKIGIIEDNPLVSLSYKIYLSQFPDFELIFRHSSIEELENYCRNAKNQPPDLVFLDPQLPGRNGLDAIPLLLKENPKVKIVVISALTAIDKIREVFKMGAHGFISKAMPLSELNRAIHDVLLYGSNISPDIAAILLQNTGNKINKDIYTSLSRRELDIAYAMVDGKSYKELAQELFVSVHTINFHLKNIYRKLDVKSKSQLISLLLSEKASVSMEE